MAECDKKLNMTKKFVIALGGSAVVPQEIDTDFLREFYVFIKKQIKKGSKFIIVVGGGATCRIYQKAASKVTQVMDEDKDWIGVHSTRLNAHLLRTIFRKQAHPVIFEQRFKIKSFGRHSIIIGAGWGPGWSTDFVACQIAADFRIKQVLILGKPAYVYTANPDADKAAKAIKKLTWPEFFKLIPKKWSPGLHSPVDPVAARLAKKQGLKVIVARGRDLANLKNILSNKKFKGTTIV